MNRAEDKALQVSAALIVRNNRLFIAQRPPWKRHGFYWEFPGGQVELGESPGASLIREIQEELNWRVRIKGLFQVVRERNQDLCIDLHVFWCEWLGGRLRLKEHLAHRWVGPAELDRYRLTAADRSLIPLLRCRALE
ncbi:MAG: 8-oxo-dGTP diphosphatase MutT [Syntrophobacteraceae bacterium CG07_land_8_20_14_0_80_61_8]|nr:MAG: 8-oxo-dGTP diphosphatase MutT [Syntrophobacteraceae bacterium CG07_land_8_20_14_0_80_61_8]